MPRMDIKNLIMLDEMKVEAEMTNTNDIVNRPDEIERFVLALRDEPETDFMSHKAADLIEQQQKDLDAGLDFRHKLMQRIDKLEAALLGIAARKHCFNDINGCIASQVARAALEDKE